MRGYLHSKRDKLLYKEPEFYKYTWFLIGLLILVYLFEIFYLQETLKNYMTFSTDVFTLEYFYTLFTSIFLHLNLSHLVSNLIALYFFGRLVEKHLGVGVVFAFVFGGVFANIVSSIISYLIGDLFYSLGASGGIAGLIMLAILLEPFRITTFLGWFLIYLDVVGLRKVSTTNHLAHLGGYMALVFLFFFLNFRDRQKLIRGLIINLVFIFAFMYLIYFTPVMSLF